MATLRELLPPANSSRTTQYDHSNDPWFKQRYTAREAERSIVIKIYPVPLYLKRDGFRPSKPEDFGVGGAFPEIHYAQYPHGMGRNTDARIVKQNENASKIVYSQYWDLVPKILKNEEEQGDDSDKLQREIQETTMHTKMEIEKIVNMRLSATQVTQPNSKFMKYKPSRQSTAFDPEPKERIVRVVETAVDPLNPPKFKHKRVPKGPDSPPVPVMHSPPRPVTAKDQQDWNVSPCVSNWKNPKGYTIPLDKRLAADGRGLQEVHINDGFAELSEAMHVAEQMAREAVAMRCRVQKEMMMKEKERKEQGLRTLAQKARSEGTLMDDTDKQKEEILQREKIREERRRERERERRLEANDATRKKSKVTRDRDRDISEKVALGMASTGAAIGKITYDQRLFNQEMGMGSGFASDDQYNVYDKGLFNAQPTLSTLYRPKKDMDGEMYGGDEQMEEIMSTDRFKPDIAFEGTSQESGPRDGPVEFEKEVDPFGLDQFFTEVNKGNKAMY